ncbi:hypothetical protein Tco_1401530 [Tanacetum coccineum]
MMGKLFRMELELMLFWSTVVAKTINGEVQLHALVDGKKIIVTESSVRRDLQLADEEGIDCLPNSTIFEQLTRMGDTEDREGGWRAEVGGSPLRSGRTLSESRSGHLFTLDIRASASQQYRACKIRDSVSFETYGTNGTDNS